MFTLLRPSYDFALLYAKKLVDDIPDQRLCDQPVPGQVMNHAAFLLGHLAWTKSFGLIALGQPAILPATWAELFATDVPILKDRALYPPKAELMQALEDGHNRLWNTAAQAATEILNSPAPRGMEIFPTVGHMVAGIMSSHYGAHTGQLSAWRRALGFTPVFVTSLQFPTHRDVLLVRKRMSAIGAPAFPQGLGGSRIR